MNRTGAAVVLVLVAAVSAVNAAYSMLPCSPRQAVIGLLFGCVIGVLAAKVAVRIHARFRAYRRFGQAAVFWLLLTGLILLLHISRVHTPHVPGWTELIAEFFTGGMYLSLVAAPFTLGVCLWFHGLGAKSAQSNTEEK